MTNKTTTNIIMYLHFKIIKSILFKKVILPNPTGQFSKQIYSLAFSKTKAFII